MAEYELHVVFRQVYKVFVDADDDDTAEELALKKIQEHGHDEDAGVWLLDDGIDVTIENIYED